MGMTFLKNHPSSPWLNQGDKDTSLFLQMNCSAIMDIQLRRSNYSDVRSSESSFTGIFPLRVWVKKRRMRVL